MTVKLNDNLYGKVFAKSESSKSILILNTTRECLRIKQRSKNIDGNRCKPFKFVSFKEMKNESKKNNMVIDNIIFFNKSKL